MTIRLLALLLLVSTLVSCTEVIDINLNEGDNNKLVVEGSVSNEYKRHSVRLTRTASYFYNQATPTESNASIVISDSRQSYPLTETETAGNYETEAFRGIAGETYTLHITLSNGETYTAESQMKASAPIDSIMVLPLVEHPWYGAGYSVVLFTTEMKGVGDAYILDLALNGELLTDTLRNKSFVSDVTIDGQTLDPIEVFWIEQDKVVKDFSEVKVRMTRVPQDYMDFIINLFLETDFRGGLFDGPAANIVGNVSGGALGYFVAEYATTAVTILPKE